MSKLAQKFMSEVLGVEGSRALRKAGEREPELDRVIIPRAIIGWLNFTTELGYEGAIPGFPNSWVEFNKSEQGYSGSISMGDGVYTFDKSNVYHLAASIAMAIGLEPSSLDVDLRDTVLAKLGKSVDLLCKAQVLAKELKEQKLDKKVLDPNSGITMHHEHHDLGGGDMLTHVKAIHPSGQVVGEAMFEHKPGNVLKPADVTVHPSHRRTGIASAMYGHAEKLTGKKIAPSTAQTTAGQALWSGNKANPQFGKSETKTKLPIVAKQPKLQSLSIDKSEAMTPCDMCGGVQFKNDKFVGCICLADLRKSVRTTTYSDGLVLEFEPGTDKEAARTLMRIFKGSGDGR